MSAVLARGESRAKPQTGGLDLRPVPILGELDREAFQRDYLRPRRPVISTALARDWPALRRWTPAFFRSEHGERRVPVYDTGFGAPGGGYMASVREMSFAQYLDCVLERDVDLRMFLYNLAYHCPELSRDVLLPEIADGFSRRFMFMFFGCRGSVTQIHYDIDLSHVFHTVVAGTKRVVLFAPEDSRNLYRHPLTVRSYVDVNAPDLVRFPRLAETRGWEARLGPGDTLFIPAGYWHHVEYEEGGYAVSLRCANERFAERLRGYANLLVVSPADRLANRLWPRQWFAWKERTARRRADGRARVVRGAGSPPAGGG